MNLKNLVFIILLSGIIFTGCDCSKGKDIPDVSNIEVDVKIKRFDRDLFNLDTLQLASSLGALEEKYPDFSNIYFEQLLGSKDPRIAPLGHESYVNGFVNFPAVRHLYDTCQIVFSDMKDLQTDFEQAMRFFKYYFPNETVPGITAFISEFSVGAFIFEEKGKNALAVGLDFFLGENFPYRFYNPGNPNFSAYLTRTFNKDHLILKLLKPLIKDMLGNPPGNRLLDYMIHHGKEWYVLQQLLPTTPDSVLLEFSQKQVEWVGGNEFQMWAHLLGEDLFYSTDWDNIRKLVEYSPHSPGMPPEAPGRTANWMGLQIVKSYMKRYPDTTLPELSAMKDSQVILDKSKYKPRR